MFGSMMRRLVQNSWRTFHDIAHSEHKVVLSDFFDTDLPTLIYNKGYESLYGIPVTCPSVIIQEFYSNMHGFDYFVPQFITHVRGTHIIVTPDLISEVLHVLRVAHPDYLDCDHLRTVSKDELISFFVSVHLFRVIVSSPLVWPLLKALGFLTWS